MNVKCIFDEQNNCIDLEIIRENGSPLNMLGQGGQRRELSILPQNLSQEDIENHLFVFLGVGMGFAFEKFKQAYPQAKIAIVDKEHEILKALNHNFDEDVLFIKDSDRQTVLNILSKWQDRMGQKPFYPIAHPFYQRLNREYYTELKQNLLASQKFDFWSKVKYPKFKDNTVKLLLISSKYFLLGEVERACEELAYEFRHVAFQDNQIGSQEFIELLLKEILNFKPDAILTLNHSGLDIEGLLMDLVEKTQIPLISWFLDNPHLILSNYSKQTSPFLHIFTWDMDNLESLKKEGMENVYYLPLGTDSKRFHPNNIEKPVPPSWKADISFVGNSMYHKVEKSFKKSGFDQKSMPKLMWQTFLDLGLDFTKTAERSIENFINSQTDPERILFADFYNKLDITKKLGVASALTWEATKVYRLSCVKMILDFSPLILGDDGWKIIFKDEKRKWSWHDTITYYNDLPYFYSHSKINFNCTSMQMKNASNQRILDVPATNSFILTDYREQMETMFEIGKEIICYHEQAQIPELIKYYLTHENERKKIAEKGRARVLKCHTWKHRLEEIILTLKNKIL